jgi:GNAT superfamily N-acetyltransferase
VNAPTPRIRPAVPADIPALLALMRELAAFEGYLDRFAVTAEEALRRGFPPEGQPEFFALVAEHPAGGLVGYAAYYLLPFTYDLKPTLVLKELFVGLPGRSAGVGTALLEALRTEARQRSCGLIRWAVLPENARAKTLYRRWGGAPDAQWEYWQRSLETD